MPPTYSTLAPRDVDNSALSRNSMHTRPPDLELPESLMENIGTAIGEDIVDSPPTNSVIDRMRALFCSTSEQSFLDYLLTQIDILFGSVKSAFGMLWDVIIASIKAVCGPLCNWFTSITTKFKDTIDGCFSTLKSFFLRYAWFFCLLILGAFGVLSFKVIGWIYGSLYGANNITLHLNTIVNSPGNDTMKAATAASIVPLLSFLTASVGCLWGTQLSQNEDSWIQSRLRCFLLWGAASAAASSGIVAVIKAMPILIQSYVLKYVDKGAYLEKFCVLPFIEQATRIIEISANRNVVLDPRYKLVVNKLRVESSEMLVSGDLVTTKIQVANLNSDLIKISKMLDSVNADTGARIPPYCLQFCGAPGVGKTLMIEKLISRMGDPQIDPVNGYYQKSAEDRFWSGFNQDYKVVVFDEWPGTVLECDSDMNFPATLLTLVSSAPFRPNFASIDGIGPNGKKGDLLEDVRMVFCLGNQPYPAYQVREPSAVRSRMKFLIEMRIRKDHLNNTHNGRIDLTKYNVDQINNMEWAEFRFLDPMGYNDNYITKWGSWDELVVTLSADYYVYRRRAIAIREAKNPGRLSSELTEIFTKIGIELGDGKMKATGRPGGGAYVWQKPKKVKQATGSQNRSEAVELFDSSAGPIQNILNNSSLDAQQKFLHLKSLTVNNDASLTSHKDTILSLHEKIGLDVFNFEKCIDFIVTSKGKKKKKLEQLKKIQAAGFDTDMCKQAQVYLDVAELSDDDISFSPHHETSSSCVEEDGFVGVVGVVDGLQDEVLPIPRIHEEEFGSVSESGSEATYKTVSEEKYVLNDSCMIELARAAVDSNKPRRSFPKAIGSVLDDCLSFIKRFGNWLKSLGWFELGAIFGAISIFVARQWKSYKPPQDMSTERLGLPALDVQQDDNLLGLSLSPTYYNPSYEQEGPSQKARRSKRTGDYVSEAMREHVLTTYHGTSGSKIERNIVSFCLEKDGNIYSQQYALGIFDSWIMLNNHAFIMARAEPGDVIKIVRGDGIPIREKLEPSRLFSIEIDDLAFYNFSDKGVHFADLRPNFLTTVETEAVSTGNCNIYYDRRQIFSSFCYTECLDYNMKEHSFSVYGYKYFAPHLPYGSCGSPVVVSGGRYSGKILGIHCCSMEVDGGPTSGGAVQVTKEILMLLDNVGYKASSGVCDDVVPPTIDKSFLDLYPGESFPNLESVTRVEPVFVPRKSSVKKSSISIHLPYTNKKGPPVLNTEDKRYSLYKHTGDPLFNSVRRAAQIARPKISDIDKQLLSRCVCELVDHYNKLLSWPVGKKRLSVENAILGKTNYICPIDLSTSAGYPFSLGAHGEGKHGLIQIVDRELGESGVEINPTLRASIVRRLQDAKDGRQPDVVYLGYPKDEPIRLKKIEEGRARIIYCAPVDVSIVMRMLIGPLIGALHASFEKTEFASGLNPLSFDMDKLFHFFEAINPVGYMDGDYKHWDQTTSRELREYAFSALGQLAMTNLNLSSNEWAYIRDCCMNASVQIDTFRFKGDLGTLSGDPLTTIINNLLNVIVHMFAFYKLNPSSKFFEKIRLKVGGDDNLSAATADVVWNPKVFGEAVAPLGLTYWPIDKEASELKSSLKPFDQITFLGGKPVKIDDMWVGASDKDMLFEGLHWFKDEHLQQCIITFLEYASNHGECFFNSYSNIIKDALHKAGLESHFMDGYEKITSIRPGYIPPANRAAWEDFLPANQGVPATAKIVEAVMAENLDNAVGRWAKKYGYLDHLNDVIDHRSKIRKVYNFLRPYLLYVSESQIEKHDLTKCNIIEIRGYSAKFFPSPLLGKLDEDELHALWLTARTHHYQHNMHHTQYWNLKNLGDNIPAAFLEEMIVDQCAAMWRHRSDIFTLDTPIVKQLLSGIDYRGFASLPLSSRRLCAIVKYIQGEMGAMTCASSGAPVGDVDKYVTPGVDLTKIQQQGLVSMTKSMGSGSFCSDKFSIPKMDMNFGLESKVLRKIVDWKTSDAKGTKLFTCSLPGGIFSLGAKNNLQNMAFNNFMFWRGKIKFVMKINGTAFQQGMLVAAFTNNAEDFSSSSIDNVFRKSHVKIFPADNGLIEFEIPFRYLKCRWNTSNRSTGVGSNIGVFTIWVYSALTSKTTSDMVQISISTVFLDSEFTLPKPADMQAASSDKVVQIAKAALTVVDAVNQVCKLCAPTNENIVVGTPLPGYVPRPRSNMKSMKIMKATGNSYSNYSIHDIAGSVPIEQAMSKVVVSPRMDNPPLSSGAVPIQHQFSGMSKCIGLEPTVSMQLAPQGMTRTCEDTFGINISEMDIGFLASRQNFVSLVNWKVGQDRMTPLFRMALGPHRPDKDVLDGTFFPQWELLDLATFWHADIVLNLVVVKTNMHSGSLLLSFGYGSKQFPTAANSSTFMNQILDFSGDQNEAVVRIPYQAATDWLYVYNGEDTYNMNEDQHYGWLSVFIQNSLVGPTTVNDNVSIIFLMHLENVAIAVPRTQRWFGPFTADLAKKKDLTVSDLRVLHSKNFATYGDVMSVALTSKNSRIPEARLKQYFTSADDTTLGIKKWEAATGGSSEQGITSPVVGNLEPVEPPPSSSQHVVLGEKLEYPITNLVDILRRYRHKCRITKAEVFGLDEKPAIICKSKRERCITIPVVPNKWPGAHWYASWKGTIKYRIFHYDPQGSDGFSVRLHLINKTGYPRASSYTLFGDDTYMISDDFDCVTSFAGSSPALEESYPITDKTSFLDVSVPFQNIYNWLHMGDYRAALIINYDCSINTEMVIYDSAGDDFAFGNYIGCPKDGISGPKVTNSSGATIPPNISINGMMIKKENIYVPS